ncbi:hypothetical protein WN944_029101 [Citrus x changshan-huyou]|uniref:Uncharacterized protein n=1 Tax=Citrus x changshan-huyou TaxID=2935761 RepID=A0AAP0LKK2_9ROSI
MKYTSMSLTERSEDDEECKKKSKNKSFNTHSRFALPKAAGVAGSCWNWSRYWKLLELLVRRSRLCLVAGSARDQRLAAGCAVGTAGISRLAVGTARVWLLLLLVESRVWLLLVLAFGC